jgi:hypothetical protein
MSRHDTTPDPECTPSELDHVERLTVRNIMGSEWEPWQTLLEIELRPSQSKEDRRRLRLSFSGVRDLRFLDGRGSPPSQISSLKIRSIRDHQWEGCSYRVYDLEEQSLSFWCADYTVTLAQTEE